MTLTLLKRLIPSLMLAVLAGCSSHSSLPDFTASGYLADRGAVRIWRKNSDPQTTHMRVAVTPFSSGAGETRDYLWQKGKLVSIERHLLGAQPDDVTLRFDHDGSLSFMQRQLAGRREPLSADAVALYQFDAQRMLKISDDLLSGRVLLQQGRWQGDGSVTDCDGQRRQAEFDAGEQQQILRQQRLARGALNVAWLEAPAGTQLLLVTADDLCLTAPKEADF